MATKKIETNGESLSRAEIERLIQVIHEKGIEEFELEQGGMRLRIVSSRAAAPAAPVYRMAPPPAEHAPHLGVLSGVPHAGQQAIVGTTPASPATSADDDPKFKKVTSPMVGTFYRSASPGSKSFVETGDKVNEDTVLCIIEAMKLMNEIKAETRGVIRRIVADNAKPVEYGQTLFVIDPG
ncbi:acetyl-CoA carboxylase biotin carboxyl carrier protein [soil metagenome]